MKTARPRVRFTYANTYGVTEFDKTFQDAEFALSYISGYIGNFPCKINNFSVEWEWE